MNDKSYTQTKKRAENARKVANSASDAFTSLCAQQFGAECVKEHRFYKPRRWRFDYALPQYKIAVEVEGGLWMRGRHIRPQGFINDMHKYNTAALLGWRVFRVQPTELLTESTLNLIKNAINGSFL